MLKINNGSNVSSSFDLISKLALVNQENNKSLEKNLTLRQLLENSGKKSQSKTNSSDSSSSSSSSKFGYILVLLSSVFLIFSWLASWTNGTNGGGRQPITTTPILLTSTTEEPTNRTWKYDCQYGYQGRHCDG